MCKLSNQPKIRSVWSTSKKINKQSKQKDKVTHFSTHNILNCPEERNEEIIGHIKKALQKVLKQSKEGNKKRLTSALNISSDKSIMIETGNIPSIENLISSTHSLLEEEQLESEVFSQGFQISGMPFFIESQPQLMLNYVYLVKKALNNLGFPLSNCQNEILMLGVWNILLKYWSDHSEEMNYPALNAQIEWGILELLNFDLKMSKKQRVLFETQIKSLTYLKE